MQAGTDEYANPGQVPEGYAAYQLDPISYSNHRYFGWKLVKQKLEDYTDENGVAKQRQVDDGTAAVIYDEQTAAIMANANLLKLAANQQVVNAQLLKELAVLKGAEK
ncbi:hypothetical protein [Levilactobacillus sp. N40-8-2]|uniref:hypothetical protein n=1 Tax=Levilactobacillus muriae TaxID=3238987 RepID=UPI0038B3FF8A